MAKWIYLDGHAVTVLSEGWLLNLGSAAGHPPFAMSNSFTNQVLAQMELFLRSEAYPSDMYLFPEHLDEEIACLHPPSLGAEPSILTRAQADYLGVPVTDPLRFEHYRY